MMERAKLRRRLQFLIQLQQLRRLRRAKVKKRRCWVREIFQSRAGYGAFETLFNALRNDRELFFRYIRMTPERFDHLLSLVKEQIEKKDTCFRKSIPAAARLVITLRYLASGETQSLSYSYRVGRSTISNIVSETCIAIYEYLKDPYHDLQSMTGNLYRKDSKKCGIFHT